MISSDRKVSQDKNSKSFCPMVLDSTSQIEREIPSKLLIKKWSNLERVLFLEVHIQLGSMVFPKFISPRFYKINRQSDKFCKVSNNQTSNENIIKITKNMLSSSLPINSNALLVSFDVSRLLRKSIFLIILLQPRHF